MAKKIALFASGAGSNVLRIIDFFKGNDDVQVVGVFCNKKDAPIVDKIRQTAIPIVVFDRKSFQSEEFVAQFKTVDLIILAGFLWKIPEAMVAAYPQQIINIHPSLLPKYGGKNMYGMNVHRAVIEHKESESGITIHYVNSEYDQGAIIRQERIPTSTIHTPEELAEAIHQLEYQYFPLAIAEVLGI